MHQIATSALPAFGLEGSVLTGIQHLVNSSFRVQHRQGDWYLRLYHPHRYDRNSVEAELVWLDVLARAGLPVPNPHTTLDGAYVWQTTSSSGRPYLVSLTAWIEGVVLPGAERAAQHYVAVGALLAQLHDYATQWQPPIGFQRPRCDAAGIYGPLGVMGRTVEVAWQNVTPEVRADLEVARDRLLQAERAIGQTAHCYGLIHGDPSFGNLLFCEAAPALIDFDDCGFGFYSYDLAVVLAGAWGKANYHETRQALLAGYEAIRPLETSERVAIPAMMAARAASLIFWAAAQDAAHPWIAGQHERLVAYLK
ncbi:MAG: phosphotransferase [Caldilineaceae bacterium]|nr:phosphotransferase [Caldilineaceae bacterium]